MSAVIRNDGVMAITASSAVVLESILQDMKRFYYIINALYDKPDAFRNRASYSNEQAILKEQFLNRLELACCYYQEGIITGPQFNCALMPMIKKLAEVEPSLIAEREDAPYLYRYIRAVLEPTR